MGVFLLLCLALLRNVSINHALAMGDEESTTTMFKPKSLKRSFMDKRIMALSFAMFCFHLSNAAMLPLLSQRAHTLGIDSNGAYAAATIIIAQSTMIFIALVCGKLIVILWGILIEICTMIVILSSQKLFCSYGIFSLRALCACDDCGKL